MICRCSNDAPWLHNLTTEGIWMSLCYRIFHRLARSPPGGYGSNHSEDVLWNMEQQSITVMNWSHEWFLFNEQRWFHRCLRIKTSKIPFDVKTWTQFWPAACWIWIWSRSGAKGSLTFRSLWLGGRAFLSRWSNWNLMGNMPNSGFHGDL